MPEHRCGLGEYQVTQPAFQVGDVRSGGGLRRGRRRAQRPHFGQAGDDRPGAPAGEDRVEQRPVDVGDGEDGRV
ncbi:hypothetical protein, partial [Streptomyces sp. SA15]|uniref:hypothetical protein n=1 Tax=Streptomyces sp. SA15 TaxID=934019 RepID=UPI00211BC1A3